MRCLVLAVAAGFLLVGCGEDEQGQNGVATDPAQSDVVPRCSDVWVEDQVLPSGYAGCRRNGALVEPQFFECEDEPGRLTTYRERFVAELGETIHAIQREAFTATFFVC